MLALFAQPLSEIRWLFFALTLLAGPIAAAPKTPLIFAGDKDYAPIIFLENGIAKGIYVDIINAMQLPGHTVEIRLIEWSEAQRQVLAGQADIAMGLSPTEVRKKSFDFSDTVMPYEYGIFVKNSNTTLHSFKDLENKLIAVTSGGLPRNVLQNNPKIRLNLVENVSEGLQLVQQGKVDALVSDKWVTLYTMHENRIEDISPATGEAVITRYGAFGLRKGNSALVQILNAELNRLKNSGKLDEIFDHWSPNKIVYFTERRLRNITVILSAGTLAMVFMLLILWIRSLQKNLKKLREAEGRLSENQDLFEKLTRQVPGLIYQFKMDPSGKFSIPYASDAIVPLSGLTAEQAKQDFSLLTDQVHPDDKAGFRESILRSAQEMTQWEYEYRVILPDQRVYWRKGESRPEKMSDGTILWHGYISDSTERREREAQIVQLSSDIIDLREKERSEVSTALHDSIAQNLVLLKLQLHSKLKGVLNEGETIPKHLLSPIDDAIATARAISHQLSPMLLESVGLQGAIEDLCDQIKKAKEVKISVDVQAFAECVPLPSQIHVYRIIQEALTNTLQHGNADQIRIYIVPDARRETLVIEDNGVAEDFQPEVPWGTGLRIMQERARILGAEFSFKLTATGAQNRLVIPRPEKPLAAL